jgi:hypothetical protein
VAHAMLAAALKGGRAPLLPSRSGKQPCRRPAPEAARRERGREKGGDARVLGGPPCCPRGGEVMYFCLITNPNICYIMKMSSFIYT